SGSVAIKPSGWGTRVTLTVLHEARADEQPAPGPSPVEATGAPEAPGPSPVEATGAPEDSEPSPVEAAGAPEDSPHASAEAAAALDSSPVSGVEPGPEPEPAPARTAAREPVTALASWAAAFGAERS